MHVNSHHNSDYLLGIINELRKLPKETEWVEFKQNQADPHKIGEYISALSNSAALLGKSSAFPYSFPNSHLGTHSLLKFYFLLPRITCQPHALAQRLQS